MPKLKQISTNSYEKIATGADFIFPLGILKDKLVVITSAQETSRIVPTSFHYNTGVHELEVYVNGQYKRSVVAIDAVEYGDYAEYTNFSVKFEPSTIVEGDQVRFRVTTANYRASSATGEVDQIQSDVTQNTINISTNDLDIATNENNITQIGQEIFGDNYVPTGLGSPTTRTIGTMINNDATPDISGWRTWKTATGGSPVLISNFDNCRVDDIKYIIFSNALTSIMSNGNIKLSGGLNFNGSDHDLLTIIFDGVRWREATRSLNS